MDKQTILIVDDVELNRAILAELFSDIYHILEAENGREALDILEKDIDPGRDGIARYCHACNGWF